MAQQTINTGSIAGDHTGEDGRSAFTKVNANFTELYTGSLTNGYAGVDLWNWGLPVIVPSSGSMANNGAITLTTALPATFTACYLVLPASAISAGSSAGVYYTVMSSSTVGQVFNNVLASGKPTIPASPTAFVTTGPGAYSQSTSAVNMLTLSIPGNSMGTQGSLVTDIYYLRPSSANTVVLRGSYAGTGFFASAVASVLWAGMHRTLRNMGATNLQVWLGVAGTGVTDTAGINTAQVTGAGDSTTAQNLILTGQLTTSALDYLVIIGGTITAHYSA